MRPIIRAFERRPSHGSVSLKRKANVLIETAVVLPVLLFVVFGMIEFGQFFYIRNAFQSTARDVARASCLSTALQTDPANRATITLAQANVTFNSSWMTIVDKTNGNATVSDVSGVPVGDVLMVTVQTQYNSIPNAFRPLYSLTGVGVGNGRICTGQCTMIKD